MNDIHKMIKGANMLRANFQPTETSSPTQLDATQLDDGEFLAFLADWNRVQHKLKAELGPDIFQSWFGSLEALGIKNSVAHFTVPTLFLKSWVSAHYIERMLTLLQIEDSSIERVTIVVRSVGQKNSIPRATISVKSSHSKPSSIPHLRLNRNIALDEVQSASSDISDQDDAKTSDGFDGSPLDRRLNLDSFHVGKSNALAHTACQQIIKTLPTETPIYNPLYVHAAVGLGKTHLLQATAQAAEASGRRVIYLTAEKFMYGFVLALKAQTALVFKEKLRAIDILVIDDVQFLHGKSIQQEFCHTLNALIDAGRQVIVAADRSPADLEALDERVRSRLAGGLVVEIGTLDEELRVKILEARVAAARVNFPEFHVSSDVIQYVANTVTANGRDLEGAMNRLLAHTTLSGQTLDVDAAEVAIRDLVRTRDPKRVKIEDIQRLVANHFNVSRADILSSRRTATVVRPRQIAMYLSKSLTLRSLPEIGRRFGGRDHTTVLHAVRKVEGLVVKDTGLAGEIELLRRMLQD
jgi:chromosomal replication initiator protein